MRSRLELIIFICGGLLIVFLALHRTQPNPRAVIWSDAEGYYKYLPGLFILKDFHKLDAGSVWPYLNDKGEYVDKYTCGVAYFEFPFFAVAQFININYNNHSPDYYNPVFSRAVTLCGVFFGLLGLWLLFNALKREFSAGISWWTIICVFFGTNLSHYTTKEMGAVHVYDFFLFSWLIFHLPNYLKKPGFWNSLLLGIILGWMLLIRPTNIVACLFILGYNVYTVKELKERFHFYLRHPRSLIAIGFGIFCMIFPQLLYWKEMTGHWFYYSYTEEGFKYWKNPHLAAVLFDVQNGLFIYSPLALLMILGIILGIKFKKWSSPVLLLIFLLATYAFASWWAWWFGGAFGHRCYVEYYALFALPLAGLMQIIYTSKRQLLKIGFSVLTVAMIIYSVRLSFLYISIGGPWDGQDWRWNWEKYQWIMSHFF